MSRQGAGLRGGHDAVLNVPRKAAYALGDFTVNTALASMSLIYASFYLTQVAGMRPALAGLVPLVARTLDAFTDPLMGRISDRTTWRWGRRRPYFLLGAVPFGVSFSILWVDVPLASEAARFAYYTGAYCLLSVSMTVLSVPYLALLPEMAVDYDERTSLNSFRYAGSVMGIFAAVCIRPIADAFGGGAAGFAFAGTIFGVMLTVPWLLVHRVSFERPTFRSTAPDVGFVQGLKIVTRHRTFLKLMGFYLCGRIAMDVIGVMLILYFTYWIGRSGDFEISMLLFFSTVVVSLPVWLRVARHYDKASLFVVGSAWWMTLQLLMLVIQPDWPRPLLLAFLPVVAVGYAVVDLMPWAMIGDVIDEDDLLTGQRREGLYNGVFTFLRKLGGAFGVFLALGILDLAGFVRGQEQTEATKWAIRLLTGAAPPLLLAVGIWLALGYPLTREAHARTLAQLAARKRPSPQASHDDA